MQPRVKNNFLDIIICTLDTFSSWQIICFSRLKLSSLMTIHFKAAHIHKAHMSVADLGGTRGGRAYLLVWVKKEGMTEGRNSPWASQIKPGPLLSSTSGSATVCGSIPPPGMKQPSSSMYSILRTQMDFRLC